MNRESGIMAQNKVRLFSQDITQSHEAFHKITFNIFFILQHLEKVTKAIVAEPLFRIDGLEFMVGRGRDKSFSFYKCKKHLLF